MFNFEINKNNPTIYMVNLVMGSVDVSTFLMYFETIQKHAIGLLQITIGLMGVYYTYKNNNKK